MSVDGVAAQYLPHVQKFDLAYQNIVDALTKNIDEIPPVAAARLIRLLEYNVLGGKKIRGLTLVLAYHMLSRNLSSREAELSCILGWCIEILHGFFIVYDDIMDCGTLRRGKPCWYRVPDVGPESVNDGLLLETSIYKLIETNFFGSKLYNTVIQEFIETTRKTVYGQCLDMASNPVNHSPVLEKFTLNYYKTIVRLKTSYYTFCLPVHLAMHLVGAHTNTFFEEHYRSTEDICVKLGYLFQMQDDYLDTFGKHELTGKCGSDIREGKCTWFAASALENSGFEEKKIMIENYGVDDPDAVKKILQIYDALGLKEKYLTCEQNLYSEISALISELDKNILNPELFTSLLNYIYRREK